MFVELAHLRELLQLVALLWAAFVPLHAAAALHLQPAEHVRSFSMMPC